MQFNKLNVVNGALSTDASTVGHVLSALKWRKGYWWFRVEVATMAVLW